MITIKERFGRRVKNLRGIKEWTQEELAEKMDISLNYLSSIERGQENPTFDMLIKLSEALGVEMRELFDIEHEVTPERLRKMLNKLAGEVNEDKLKIAVRILEVVAK